MAPKDREKLQRKIAVTVLLALKAEIEKARAALCEKITQTTIGTVTPEERELRRMKKWRLSGEKAIEVQCELETNPDYGSRGFYEVDSNGAIQNTYYGEYAETKNALLSKEIRIRLRRKADLVARIEKIDLEIKLLDIQRDEPEGDDNEQT